MALPRSHPNCCACDCIEGSLPFTFTATFSGFGCGTGWGLRWTEIQIVGCFGGGVRAVGSADTFPGALTAAKILDGGSGFAIVGRSQPTLTATPTGGTGGVLSVTLGTDTDGPLDYWGVASIAVTTAGSGYTDGSVVAISHAVSDSVVTPAAARVRAARDEPTITASAAGGSGASLTVNLTPVAWGVSSVSGTATGVDYGSAITFSPAAGVTETTAARGVFITTLEEPGGTINGTSGSVAATFTQSTYPDGRPYWVVSGYDTPNVNDATAVILSTLSLSLTGAAQLHTDGHFKAIATDTTYDNAVALIHICNGGHSWRDTRSVDTFTVTRSGEYTTTADPTIEPTVTVSGHAGCTVTLVPVAWGVDSVTIDDGGTGYTDGDTLSFAVAAGDTIGTAGEATITTDGYGSITGVTVDTPGRYYRLGGIDSVVVLDGGHYYKDDPAASPYVADLFIHAPNDNPLVYWGDRAVLSATVDSDITSATWGQVAAGSLTIDDGGDGYSINAGLGMLGGDSVFQCFNHNANDLEVIFTASNARPLVHYRIESCFGSGARATVYEDDYYPINSLPIQHVEPSLAAEPVGGTGGTVTLTLDQDTGDDGLPYWYIASATASGGTDYPDDTSVNITSTGDFPCVYFSVAPVVTATASSGALTSATITQAGKFWRRKPYDGGATGLPDTAVMVDGGSGYAILGREEPTVAIEAAGGGTDCTFTPTWTEDADECGRPFYTLASVAVSGGTGYIDGASLTFTATSGTLVTKPVATLSVSDGVPQSVTVASGGKGWHENPALPAIVSDVTVVVEQSPGSSGSGAVVTAVVDDDTSHSPPPAGSFGSITGLTVTTPGSGYTLLGGPRAGTVDGEPGCWYVASITTPATGDGPAQDYAGGWFASGGPCYLDLWFRGHGEKAYISEPAGPWPRPGWISVDPVTDCDFASLEFEPYIGTIGSITLTRGGTYDQCESGNPVSECSPE